MGFFEHPFVNRIRRNHGLEHATIHILSQTQANLSMVGRSDWDGFTLYGPVDTAAVKQASQEALQRLRNGEAGLAVHPRCGTVLATTGLLTGLAAFVAVGLEAASPRGGGRFRWAAIPAAILAATMAAIFAQPIGMFFQENFTVNGDPGTLAIKRISLEADSPIIIHRVETTQ
ncbi:MAG: DUF6391 domain-containing protein [Anaerolineae bacterium]|nr:DUF6391 domain-containing protein [Anaerolineae bacterium]